MFACTWWLQEARVEDERGRGKKDHIKAEAVGRGAGWASWGGGDRVRG